MLAAAFMATTATAQFERSERMRRSGSPPPSRPVPREALLGGVPSGPEAADTLELSLLQAVDRGLRQNLAALLGDEQVQTAAARQQTAQSFTLPQLLGELSFTRREFNLAATGFREIPGFDRVVGPFDVFDARLFLTYPLFDLSAHHDLRAARANLNAEEHRYAGLRELVVLAVASLYLNAVADGVRLEAARAQVELAQTLYDQAVDRKAAGLIAGIEVLRADVQRQEDTQREIAARAQREKARLRLARAIGLPPRQPIELTDTIEFRDLPDIDAEEAAAYAFLHRRDYLSSVAELEEARAEAKAAAGERWPDLLLDADYGAIGVGPVTAEDTFGLGAHLRLPLYRGGRIDGWVQEAEAEMRRRELELEDLRAGVYHQIASAFLDIEAADQGVEVSRRALELAGAQLEQARHRFEAGVADNIEVVQAQEVLARINEERIDRLLDHRLARGALAQALGVGELDLLRYLAGEPWP